MGLGDGRRRRERPFKSQEPPPPLPPHLLFLAHEDSLLNYSISLYYRFAAPKLASTLRIGGFGRHLILYSTLE